MELQLNINLDPSITDSIKKAIDNKQAFGLTNGRTISLFNPVNFTQVWFGNSRTYLSRETAFNYPSLNSFLDAVKLALLGQREFIAGPNLLEYCKQKNISIPKQLNA